MRITSAGLKSGHPTTRFTRPPSTRRERQLGLRISTRPRMTAHPGSHARVPLLASLRQAARSSSSVEIGDTRYRGLRPGTHHTKRFLHLVAPNWHWITPAAAAQRRAVARLTEQARRKQQRGGKTTRATSCGGIVLRDADGTTEICLGRRQRATGKSGTTWTLPKGTPNDGESIDETALREVAEETGLEVSILAPVGAIEYFFTQSGERIHKTVHYFLMQAIGGSLEAHDHEFDEVRWMPIDEARRLMTFETERQILEEALPVVHPGAA